MAHIESFVTSAIGFSSHTNIPVLKNQNCLSFTPFPENNWMIPFHPSSLYDISMETIQNICDVHAPLDLKNIDVKRKNLEPGFRQKTFLLFIEVSEATVKNGIIKEFCNNMRNFGQRRVPVFFSIIAYGSSFRFPVISKNGKSMRIGTYSELFDEFPFIHETIYFNMLKMNDLFLKYIDILEEMVDEPVKVSIFNIITCFSQFICGLKNPVFIIGQSLNDVSKEDAVGLSIMLFEKYFSVDFFLYGSNVYPNLIKLFTTCNCKINRYGVSQTMKLVSDIFREMAMPCVRYCSIVIKAPTFIKINKIVGPGIETSTNTLRVPKVCLNDTYYVFYEITDDFPCNHNVFIHLMLRYLDFNMERFYRVIPFLINHSTDVELIRKSICASTLLASSAILICQNVIIDNNVKQMIGEHSISLKSDILKEYLPNDFPSLASAPLHFVSSFDGIINTFGKRPLNIFRLLSPVAYSNDHAEWMPITKPLLKSTVPLVVPLTNKYVLLLNEATPNNIDFQYYIDNDAFFEDGNIENYYFRLMLLIFDEKSD